MVYRVGDIVAKVYSPTPTVERYARASTAAARLAELGLPVLCPLDGGSLVHHETGSVGFWPWVEVTREAGWADLGAVLGQLHRVTAPISETFDLPRWTGVTFGTRWATDPYRARDDALREVADRIDELAVELSARVGHLAATDTVTVIHGDAQLNNVLVAADGPRLIDFDWTEVGPYVDVSVVDCGRRRQDISQAQWAEFGTAYGHSFPSAHASEASSLCALQTLSDIVFRLAMDCRRSAPVDWVPAAVVRLF